MWKTLFISSVSFVLTGMTSPSFFTRLFLTHFHDLTSELTVAWKDSLKSWEKSFSSAEDSEV